MLNKMILHFIAVVVCYCSFVCPCGELFANPFRFRHLPAVVCCTLCYYGVLEPLHQCCMFAVEALYHWSVGCHVDSLLFLCYATCDKVIVVLQRYLIYFYFTNLWDKIYKKRKYMFPFEYNIVSLPPL